MSSVEDQIVRMQFDNSRFEGGVAKTLSTLDRLKRSLSFGGAGKGLDGIEKSANSISLSHISDAVDGIKGKFSALSIVAITALTNIANRAINAGLSFAKSFTVGPIIDGLHEYETNLQSIQTIQSNTDQPLSKVNASLQELNTYSDQTIYNFSEMAKNIGTFTAAGVDLKTATSSIKGIANLAALSGSSSEQAATAMYQLSQAISSGKVGLQDWNSVVNAGMGGKKLQTALATTAVAMGKLGGNAIGTSGKMKTLSINGKSFRESITAKPGDKPWLSSEVLVNTLATLDGRFSVSALMAQKTKDGLNKYTKAQALASIATSRTALEQKNGVKYTDAQFKSLMHLSDSAFKSATQVKTLSQVFDVAKETIGSGWGQSFQSIFGTFGEAKKTFTELSNTINGVINANALARNNILHDWKAMGGRTVLIEGIKDAFTALNAVLKPLKEAFRDIFPRKTGADLYHMTVGFKNFMESLKIGPATADKLKRSFAGFFAIFSIAKTIIHGVFLVIHDLFNSLTGGGGSFLDITAKVGDFLVALDKTLKKGDGLRTFFRGLTAIMTVPIQLIKSLGKFIGSLFDGFDKSDAQALSNSLGGIGDRLSKLSGISDKIGKLFDRIKAKLKPVVDAIVSGVKNIGTQVAAALHGTSFDQVLKVIQTGLLGGIVLMLKKFAAGGLNVNFGGGIFDKLGETFDVLTNKTKAMTTEIKSNTLLKIAAAIALLTASVVALSTINSAKLADSLKAMAVGFGELLGAMAILTKISGSAGFVKVPIIAASMILLSSAVLILTVALKNLSSLSWDELKKGLTGVGALLLAISIAVIPLSKNSAGMIKAGVGMIAIAAAMNLLYLAVKNFSGLSWQALGKGLAAVVGSILGIALAMRLMPKNMLRTSAGLLLLSIAVNALYLGVKSFSKLDWKTMGRGLAGVAGSLVAVAIGMRAMPKNIVMQAAGLVIVSGALLLIGRAVSKMGGLSFEVIGKGLGTIAAALIILAVGLHAMAGTIRGSIALLGATTALTLLTPVLITLGSLSWKTIIKSMVALAAAFLVLAVGGLALTPVAPALIALGLAAVAVGAGIALAGAGIGALSAGLGVLAKSGAAGLKVLLDGFAGFIKQIPALAVGLAQGLIQFIVVIGKNAPIIAKAFGAIITSILKVLVDNAPKIANAAFQLIISLVNTLTNNAPKLVTAVSNLIVALLKGLSDNLPKLLKSGADFIVDFMNGLADAIQKNIPRILKAGVRIGVAIVKGIWQGISDFFGWLWGKIKGFFSDIWNAILEFFGIRSPSKLAADLGANIIKGIWQGISSLGSWLWGLAKGLFKGLMNIIGGIFSGAFNLGKALLGAIGRGISGAIGGLKSLAVGLFHGIMSGIGAIFSGGLALGKALLGAIGKGISAAVGGLKSLAVGAWHATINAVKSVVSDAKSIGSSFMGTIGAGITGARGHIVGSVAGAFGSAKAEARGQAASTYSIGQLFAEGIANGIRAKAYLAIAAAASLASVAAGIMGATLDLHSPSRVTMYMGEMVVAGLTKGIDDNAHKATASAGGFANGLVKAFNETFSGFNTNTGLNLNPTITPVLDLTNIRKNAGQIHGLLGGTQVQASVSYTTASNLSNARQQVSIDAEKSSTAPTSVGTTVKLEQNNYSPKALSTVEIYRNTKNQLAMVKSALGVS